MTTLASPTLNGAAIAVWRVAMAPGSSGPVHAVDADQVLTVEDGELEVEIAGARTTLGAGDTIFLPAGERRVVRAHPATHARALVASTPNATATTADRTGVPVPWAA
jgi:quercetin dioxygenase-like cupin family protein